MPKKFISSLLTAILTLSSLLNQSAGAMENINNSSSMIEHSSSIHKSNDKKLISSETTLKKSKVPLVATIGTVLTVGVTSLIVYRIRNAKIIEEVKNKVHQAFGNETVGNITPENLIDIVHNIFQELKGENITPDKFIALVDTICEELTMKSQSKVNGDIINNLYKQFTKLKNEVMESVKLNKFNGAKFTEKILSDLLSLKQQKMEERIKAEQEERKRKEQEEKERKEREEQERKEREEQERKKQEEKERKKQEEKERKKQEEKERKKQEEKERKEREERKREERERERKEREERKREERERERKYKEWEERRRKKFEEQKNKLLEKHYRENETREEFIKRFKDNIYNKSPCDYDFMCQYLDDFDVKFRKSTHSDIKERIRIYADTDHNKKDFAKSVYAELMWLNYKYFIKKLEDNSIDCFCDNYNRYVTYMMKIMLPVKTYYEEGSKQKKYCACKTYEDFLEVIEEGDCGYCFMEFYKDNDNKLGCEFRSIVCMLNYLLNRLKTTNSNYKYEMARGTLEVIGKKLDNLKEIGDPSTKFIAHTIKGQLLKPISDIVSIKSKEIKAKSTSTNKKKKYFDKNQRYAPYGKEAGRGGYGTVKIYEDTENDRKVAIKTSRGSSLNNEELKNLQNIKSDHVVKLYELTDLGDKKTGLVMEYVPGHESFSKAVFNTEKFSKGDVLDICHQLVDAIKAFADAGFRHNDLDDHTENIIIGKDGDIKVIDYENAFYDGVNNENKNKNIKIALRCIVTALYNSYPDLYEKFTEKFKTSFLSIQPRPVDKFAIVKFGENLPSFDDIIKALNELSNDFKNQ